jgi:hypothetical protein
MDLGNCRDHAIHGLQRASDLVTGTEDGCIGRPRGHRKIENPIREVLKKHALRLFGQPLPPATIWHQVQPVQDLSIGDRGDVQDTSELSNHPAYYRRGQIGPHQLGNDVGVKDDHSKLGAARGQFKFDATQGSEAIANSCNQLRAVPPLTTGQGIAENSASIEWPRTAARTRSFSLIPGPRLRIVMLLIGVAGIFCRRAIIVINDSIDIQSDLFPH